MIPVLLTLGVVLVIIAAWILWRRGTIQIDQTFHFRCNHCRQKLRYRAESQGRRILCPHCLLPCKVPTTSQSSTA
jgi:hypothetical protein